MRSPHRPTLAAPPPHRRLALRLPLRLSLHLSLCLLLLCAAAAAGCQGDATDPGPSADPDAASGADSADGATDPDADPNTSGTSGTSGADGATDPDADPDASDTSGADADPDAPPKPQTCSAAERPPHRAVISRLIFTRELSSGVAEGMDLDQTVTLPGDATGCRKVDFTDPDGTPGVDNQFVTLLPAFEAVGGEEGVDSAIQRAINEGSVLLVIELEGLDDTQDDPCVAAQFSRADGRPTLGADGLLEPSQTLDRFPDYVPNRVPDAALVDGQLTLGPVNLTLPMYVSGFDILLTFHDTWLRFSIADDGSLHGLLSGSLSLEELFTVLDQIDDGTDLLFTIRRFISGAADLDPDDAGRCQRMSIALRFDATPVFYFED